MRNVNCDEDLEKQFKEHMHQQVTFASENSTANYATPSIKRNSKAGSDTVKAVGGDCSAVMSRREQQWEVGWLLEKDWDGGKKKLC